MVEEGARRGVVGGLLGGVLASTTTEARVGGERAR